VSLRFLLDTNVVSEPIRPSPNQVVIDKIEEHRGQVGIATVVWHELFFGLQRLPPSRRRNALEKYLRQVVLLTMPRLPYDQAAAEWHAMERSRLTTLGRTPPFQDGQIAAIAKVNNLVLVTANRVHFEAFDGLQIEDWGN
jgi:tRNA(fMet)-specific endonuclease VapC